MLDNDYSIGGVLVLSDDDASKIKSSMKNQPRNIGNLYAYLSNGIEFGYYLAIQPSMNVSINPGFESYVGMFLGATTWLILCYAKSYAKSIFHEVHSLFL